MGTKLLCITTDCSSLRRNGIYGKYCIPCAGRMVPENIRCEKEGCSKKKTDKHHCKEHSGALRTMCFTCVSLGVSKPKHQVKSGLCVKHLKSSGSSAPIRMFCVMEGCTNRRQHQTEGRCTSCSGRPQVKFPCNFPSCEKDATKLGRCAKHPLFCSTIGCSLHATRVKDQEGNEGHFCDSHSGFERTKCPGRDHEECLRYPVHGCEGLCQTHFNMNVAHGKPSIEELYPLPEGVGKVVRMEGEDEINFRTDGYILRKFSNGDVKVCGTLNNDDYLITNIGGESNSNNRWLWEAFNGPIPQGYEVNHIEISDDGNIVHDTNHSNRLSNLELLTKQQNLQYSGPQKNNKSGRTGVRKVEKEGRPNRYETSICVKGRRRSKEFKTFEEGIVARDVMEIFVNECFNGKYPKEFQNDIHVGDLKIWNINIPEFLVWKEEKRRQLLN